MSAPTFPARPQPPVEPEHQDEPEPQVEPEAAPSAPVAPPVEPEAAPSAPEPDAVGAQAERDQAIEGELETVGAAPADSGETVTQAAPEASSPELAAEAEPQEAEPEPADAERTPAEPAAAAPAAAEPVAAEPAPAPTEAARAGVALRVQRQPDEAGTPSTAVTGGMAGSSMAGGEPAVDQACPEPSGEIAPAIVEASLSRRAFLGFGLMIAGGFVGAAGLARLFPVFDDGSDAASPIVPTYDPANKAWTFVVDTAACIGCGMCVVACKEENHVAEEAGYTRTWVERHVRTTDGELYVDSPDAGMYGFPAESTAPGAAGKAVDASFFEPRLCMQCEDSPCTAVCPVGATYRTEDGVILVDASRCIGCGYCVEACPYGARYLTPAGADAPNDMPGVADKCTWCYQRISRGAQPACVEVCPVGARRFGDASNPDSEIATLVRERAPQPLDPEYGTRPRVLYLGPAIEEA